ncbi:MAG TPA: PAS domain-containing protein [Bacteroidetes bacterium]|nr:PAS domain-containing protein [Bacteroidota bacterium]
MIDDRTKSLILDSLKNPVAFTDTNHIIRYMNKAAIEHYDEGENLLGRSLLDCHNEASQKMIHEIYTEMQQGLEERLITDSEKYRIYMLAVRDENGQLIGYYERYEPPRGK